MSVAEHPIAPEQVQSYVDRELATEDAAAVAAHLASCASCRELAESFESLSHAMKSWPVDEPPSTLISPAGARSSATSPIGWSHHQLLVAALAVIALGAFWLTGPFNSSRDNGLVGHVPLESASPVPDESSVSSFKKSEESSDRRLGYAGYYAAGQAAPLPAPSELTASRAAQAPPAPQPAPTRAPMVVRSASVTVVVKEFDGVRERLDQTLARTGGFIGHLESSAGRGEARSLTGTVRVPAAQLSTLLTTLKQLGTVTAESQNGEDVTDQATDLDARLTNARETEKRLVMILQQRTGKVGDVLEVEREIARVREEIERMAAQRANLADRVTYATISLVIREEQRASLEIDPPSAGGRLRNAFIQGVGSAVESALSALALLMRAGPTLLLWLAILLWPALALRRRLKELTPRP